MTTIATDGKSMAGDGQSNYATIITRQDCQKLFRLNDGRILGCTGPTSEYERFRDWLNDGASGEIAPKMAESFEALVLSAEEVRLYQFDGTFTRFKGSTALGSGMAFAIAALDLDCSPEEAVRLAATRDINTGGEITVLHLEPAVRAVA